MLMKKVLILANSCMGLLSFRKELLEALIAKGYNVVVSLPDESRNKEVEAIGCKVIPVISLSRRGKNPFKDYSLLKEYKDLLRNERPDVVLTYTIKPNIYGGMACASMGIPYIVNITGLGSAVETPGMLQKLTLLLYKVAMRKVNCIFFQNEGNMSFFNHNKIQLTKHRLIPGSGANITKFSYSNYPEKGNVIFLFISRLMKEKGIEEYFAAAEHFSKKYDDVEFHILGGCEEDYTSRLDELTKSGIIHYHGVQSDVRPYLQKASCLIHPTYYPEGMSNVILEAASIGRPVITTRRHGCMEAVDDGETGFLFPEKDRVALIECISNFLKLSIKERKEMGIKARKKMENEFNRQIVIDAYLDEISKSITYKC